MKLFANNIMCWKIMIFSQLLAFFFPMSFAVDPYCNYYQNMEVDPTYYVYNKEYPSNYGPNQNCRWIAVAPQGYTIVVECSIEIPQTSGCTMDRLQISLTGNENLENAHTYCGYGNTSLETEYNNVSIGLITGGNTQGGRFLCTLKAKSSQPPCDCGWKQTRRIVGGTETGINEYPMMAGLVDFVTKDLFCGATIISQRYGLTAAHCIKNKESYYTGFLVGEHNLSTNSYHIAKAMMLELSHDSETGATKLLQVSYFTPHELYTENDPRGEYDLALVRTATDIEYTMDIGPACLPFKNPSNSFDDSSVTALGWGTTEFTGPKSDVLLETSLDVLTYGDCYAAVGGTVDQMCTYSPGHDACQSDSGGPLLWMDTTTFRIQLVGVISSGYGCASNRPALNTRITAFLDWIRTNTPDAQYCIK